MDVISVAGPLWWRGRLVLRSRPVDFNAFSVVRRYTSYELSRTDDLYHIVPSTGSVETRITEAVHVEW